MDTNKILNIIPPLLSHYELQQQIGEGGNSTVWTVKSKDDKLYACKIPEEANELIIDEADIMGQVAKYPNNSPFLTFYGIYSYNELTVMVTELFKGEMLANLIDIVRKGTTLSEYQILSIAKSLLEQLSYLHNKGLNHGDVSNSNILYNSDRVVLIDITNQKYYLEWTNPETEAEVTRTTTKSWLNAINSGISSSLLYQKKDIFELGEIIRDLMGYRPTPPWQEFILNPDMYKVSSDYPTLNFLVNSAMNMDISQRPSSDNLLSYIRENLFPGF
jgi:serine/threonine protein kinase